MRARQTFFCFLASFAAAFAIARVDVAFGQSAEPDVAESIGVGKESRFASGATPITIERTKIIPGTPMSVNSTMSNILRSNNNTASFGGILARYDTSNFGKFFGTGTLTQRAPSARVDALDALDQSDNEVENVEVDRMYPPRLVLDFETFPMHSLSTPTARANMENVMENALARCGFDKKTESIRIVGVGSTLYVRGKVKSRRVADLAVNVASVQPGVERVVDELEVEETHVKLDVFGRPIRGKQESRMR